MSAPIQVTRRGAMIVRLSDVSPAKLTQKLTFTPKRKGKPICAAVALSGDRMAFPRYANPGFAVGKVIVDEPNNFGSENQYLRWNPERKLQTKQNPGVGLVCETLLSLGGCTMNGETGSGKTVMALAVLYRMQPKHTLVLVDRIDLARQWAERIAEYLPGTVVRFLMSEKDVQAEQVRPSNPTEGRILIATGQSIYRSLEYTADNPISCDMLVCDEAHVFSAPTFLKSILRLRYRYSLALTATVDRKDGLEKLFLSALGERVVRVDGNTMVPLIYTVPAPACGIVETDWQMFWCSHLKGMSWLVKCQACPQFSEFPNCIGNPRCFGDMTEEQKKKVKINRSGLIDAWSNAPEYVEWLIAGIKLLIARGRNMFVFADGRRLLQTLRDRLTAEVGADKIGLFLGGAGTSRKAVEARNVELKKQVTLVTYGIAAKGLDVAEKDLAFLATPIADGRQVVGRVRRKKEGKATPIVIVAVPPIPTLETTCRRFERQMRKNQWKVLPLSRLT